MFMQTISSQTFASASINQKPATSAQAVSSTLAADSGPAKENLILGPRDILCQIELAVISGAAILTRRVVSLPLTDALAPDNRGVVAFRIDQVWECVLVETILQLGRVKGTGATGANCGSDFCLELKITVKGQERILVQKILKSQPITNLESDNGASIRSRIQEACGLTVQNAIIELNSVIGEPVVRISGEAPKAEDRASVAALFGGELPFPLDALPETVRTFAESLAVQFSGVPVSVPATACLGVASEIVGTGVKIDRGYGLPLGSNLFFAVGVDPNSHCRAAVESVLNPVKRLQEDLNGQAQGKGGTGLSLPYASVLTKWRLKQNRGRSVPLLMNSGIPSVGWDKLLQSSWDGSFFHCSWDGDIVLELLQYAEKGRVHPAVKVLKRAYAQESAVFDAHHQAEGRRLQARSLGLLWLCGREVLGRFATSRALLENGLSPCFILFDSESESSALTGAVLQPSEGALDWERMVRELFECRSSAEEQVWQVCDKGAELFARFANFVRSHTPPEYPVVPAWADRVWRMTLLLHLLNQRRGAVIETDTAWHAIRLAAWYLGRQLRLLPKPGPERRAGGLSKNRVLEKIRKKGPVSERELLHSFHRMSKAELAPVVAELLRDGLVRWDENKKLVVSEIQKAAV